VHNQYSSNRELQKKQSKTCQRSKKLARLNYQRQTLASQKSNMVSQQQTQKELKKGEKTNAKDEKRGKIN
jgi:hypothetical protein